MTIELTSDDLTRNGHLDEAGCDLFDGGTTTIAVRAARYAGSTQFRFGSVTARGFCSSRVWSLLRQARRQLHNPPVAESSIWQHARDVRQGDQADAAPSSLLEHIKSPQSRGSNSS